MAKFVDRLMYLVAIVLLVLCVVFGVNLVRYSTASTCEGQFSTTRACIGTQAVTVVKADTTQESRQVCDDIACSNESKPNHLLIVRLPSGEERQLVGSDSFESLRGSKDVVLHSWNNRYIYVETGKADGFIGLSDWRPDWMVLTLVGSAASWVLLMYGLFVKRRSGRANPVVMPFAYLFCLGSIGFLLVFGITGNMLV